MGGTIPSWLPHTETQGNTIATDINVEALHQKRNNEIQNCTPFGHQFSLLDNTDNFSDLYKLICNINYNANNRGGGGSGGQWIGGKRHHHQQPYPNLDAVAKMRIALQLRGGPDWQYKFRPQHYIHGELCMILQHRAFCLTETDAIEIPIHACHPHMNENHVIVHELAFGPDSDTSVRGVSLFFNIPEAAITEFTTTQAKRYRWKRNNKKDDDKRDANKVVSVLGTLDSFEMIRPHDADAFDLASSFMQHRLHVMQAERISNMKQRFEALQSFESEKKILQKRFDDLKRHWIAWAWPVNVGRKKVDKKTPVPKVDGHYEFESVNEEKGEEPGSATSSIWETFVNESFDDDDDDMVSFFVLCAMILTSVPVHPISPYVCNFSHRSRRRRTRLKSYQQLPRRTPPDGALVSSKAWRSGRRLRMIGLCRTFKCSVKGDAIRKVSMRRATTSPSDAGRRSCWDGPTKTGSPMSGILFASTSRSHEARKYFPLSSRTTPIDNEGVWGLIITNIGEPCIHQRTDNNFYT